MQIRKTPETVHPCPFCNQDSWSVTFSGSISVEEKNKQLEEERKVYELEKKMREEEMEQDRKREEERKEERKKKAGLSARGFNGTESRNSFPLDSALSTPALSPAPNSTPISYHSPFTDIPSELSCDNSSSSSSSTNSSTHSLNSISSHNLYPSPHSTSQTGHHSRNKSKPKTKKSSRDPLLMQAIQLSLQQGHASPSKTREDYELELAIQLSLQQE